jgi:hypothetical protein
LSGGSEVLKRLVDQVTQIINSTINSELGKVRDMEFLLKLSQQWNQYKVFVKVLDFLFSPLVCSFSFLLLFVSFFNCVSLLIWFRINIFSALRIRKVKVTLVTRKELC